MESKTVTVKGRETNSAGYPLIRCFVDGITPPNAQFPIALNLTKEQGEALEDGKTEYNAVLVQGKLKKDASGNPKSGDYPDHYYYEVASFEGIVNERLMDSVKSGTMPSAPSTPSKPSGSPQSNDDRDISIKRQLALKCASWQMVPLAKDFESPEIMFQRTCELAERYLAYVITGKTDGLVQEAVKEGASVVSVDPQEELFPTVYQYPEPPQRVNSETFAEYAEKAGWNWEDVETWLDGLDPIDWVKAGDKRTLRLALRTCRDLALEIGLEPPENFRVEVKE